MHTTRLAEWARVAGLEWRPSRPIAAEGGARGSARFSGLAAGWYFDGERMHHPWLLRSLEYTARWEPGGAGALVPDGRGDLAMSGDGRRFSVGVADSDGGTRMAFEAVPWTPELSVHQPTQADLWGGWSYRILKIPALRVRGEIRHASGRSEPVEGTAYFQKVRVDAPTVPWRWGFVHADPGFYLDYFEPSVGPELLRRSDRQSARLDAARWPRLKVPSTVQFIDAEARRSYEFRTYRIAAAHEGGAPLPTYRVEARSQTAALRFSLRPHARACWRIEQRGRYLPWTPRLHYNEYPADLVEFAFEDRASGRRLARDDLLNAAGECEHAWGFLP